jgi:adenosine deaminase CECR1
MVHLSQCMMTKSRTTNPTAQLSMAGTTDTSDNERNTIRSDPADAQELQQYMTTRSAVIDEERKLRHGIILATMIQSRLTKNIDQIFRAKMSQAEIAASKVLARIRNREVKTIRANREDERGIHPAMPFPLQQDMMPQDLWKIVSRMPKGCLLHAHLDAMVDVDWLLRQALEIPGYYIYSPRGLSEEEDREKTAPSFTYAPRFERSCQESIWTTAYKSDSLVPVQEAASTFPGGVQAFKTWARSHMVLPKHESMKHHQGMYPVWRRFGGCFQSIGGLLYTEPIFRQALPRIFQQLVQDGIRYVEFRSTFMQRWHRTDAEKPDKDFSHLFETFAEELESYTNSEDGGRLWGARIIWSTLRLLGDDEIKLDMQRCIAMKQKFPTVISGFDLIGSEDDGRSLLDMAPVLMWFQRQCQDSGLLEGALPFFFHAGECLGDGDGPDHNVVDAILLGSRRIGHGFSLYKHPLLIDLCKERKVLIESCPISNEILRLTPSVLQHPLPALLARGVAVSVNNDDPAVLGYGDGINGSTNDLHQLLLALENFGMEGLGTVAENSIRWAAMEDESLPVWLRGIDLHHENKVKVKRHSAWRQDWEAWCIWIVEEFDIS